jgi:cytochrome o ubiquinol oxidase subunit 2
MNTADFDNWVQQTRDGGGELNRPAYLKLEQPSEKEPVRRYAKVDGDLYDAILNRCVESNRMCLKDMMAIDEKGGLGKAGTYNVATNASTRVRLGLADTPARNYVGAVCTPANPTGAGVLDDRVPL